MKKISRRTFLKAAVTGTAMTMGAGLLAGCGGSGSSSGAAGASATGDSGAAAGGASIVWAGWSGEEEANKEIFQRMMDTYEAETGNDVEWVGFTWSDAAQQLLIRAQGGEQLDVSQADISIFNTLAQAGVLADLNGILGEDWLKENFEQSALDVGNVDGKQLAMPWSMAAITMVYNPEILKNAGWDTPPKTIAEFEQCMADVKAADSSVIPYALSTKDTTCGADFVPWMWTYGGGIWDESGAVIVNSEKSVQALEWYIKLLDAGYVTMDVGRSEARQMFAQGKVAFYDDAVVAKSQVISNGVDPDEVVNVCSAMTRPVLAEGDDPQAVQWGSMLVIYEGSQEKEAAAELLKVLVSDEVSLDYFVNGGMPPVTKSASASDTVQNDAYIKSFIESTATARLEETARMTNADEIKTILTEEIQYALLKQKSAQEALDSAAARLAAL